MSNEFIVKRWPAKCKVAMILDAFKGKNAFAEMTGQYDLTVPGVEGWMRYYK